MFEAVDVQDVFFDVVGEQRPIVTSACTARSSFFNGLLSR